MSPEGCPRLLAEVGRQVLIRRDEFVPPRLCVAALTTGDVMGGIFGVDLPPGPVEGDLVEGHTLVRGFKTTVSPGNVRLQGIDRSFETPQPPCIATTPIG